MILTMGENEKREALAYINDVARAIEVLEKKFKKMGGEIFGEITIATMDTDYCGLTVPIRFSASTLHEYLALLNQQESDNP